MINYADFDDMELQKLASSGNSDAEGELALRYLPLVRKCARPFFIAGGERRDLIQEGTFGLLSAIRNYDGSKNASFKTFAESCIHNRLASAVRSASGKKHDPLNNRVSLEAILSDESRTTADLSTELFQLSPEEQVLARENEKSTEQLYLSLINSLSGFEKAVLEHYLGGESYKEIAQHTGKTEKAADNAIQRIRHKAMRLLRSGDNSI